jgi:3',5'-cyclic AMP phosphodiesterase CpdA
VILAQLSDPHIRLGDGAAEARESLAAGVAEVLALRPQPDGVLVSGDLADAAFTTLGGRGVFTCPGVHLTARLEIGAPDYTVVAEPPAFALHVMLDGTVTTHVQPIRR